MEKPKISFSQHALHQMVERKLSKEDIVTTILNPEHVVPQADKKFQAAKTINKNNKEYALVVIYRITNNTLKVITAFLSSKIKKYLK